MKANLGKTLGPRGLMPNKKMRTIVSDVVRAIRDSAGAADYREREGVVRLAIGQLGHSPQQLKTNLGAFMTRLKKEVGELGETTPKEIHEVILSTTNGPGISLSGKLRNVDERITEAELSGIM